MGILMVTLSVSLTTTNSQSLIGETMLHPGDAFTGYTLAKGEWAYNQAITPYPSWAWWGITNSITAELDLEAWLGGVPSFNFRFGLLKSEDFRLALAFETMYQYLGEDLDQFENLEYLSVLRSGSSWYNRLNVSWRLSGRIHIHTSAGVTYAENVRFSGTEENHHSVMYQHLVSPDFSLSFDCRMWNWISTHFTYSYGSTFLYADNIPRKEQLSVAFRVAPFIRNQSGFLRTFRFELAFIDAYFTDIGKRIRGPIGFLYWQWQWGKGPH